MKLKVKIVLSLFCSVCILIASSACTKQPDIDNTELPENKVENIEPPENTADRIDYSWALADLGNAVSLHTDKQLKYLCGDYNEISSYVKGKEELSFPKPVHLEWSLSPTDGKGNNLEKYEVEISERRDFYKSVKYETVNSELDVYNLCVSTDYFWRVTAIFSNGETIVSQESAFKTADSVPRNLYVDGVTNVRDLGGWQTADGKRVKRGMLYRGGRLNKSATSTSKREITQKGIDTMRNVLGVRTEIDLRLPSENNEITSSPLGKDINYYNVSMDRYSGSRFDYLSHPEYYDAIKQFFAYLADEKNYPIYFHCSIGTDRTGFCSFLINGLMGVSEEDLCRDYLFSNFGNIGGSRSLSNMQYVGTVKKYEGATLSEKIENCLIEVVGVEPSHIAAVRAIMSE